MTFRGLFPLMLLCLAAPLLAGCITPPPEPLACTQIDWYATGLKDGREGRGLSALDKFEARCPGMNTLAYRRGRVEGLMSYCVPENGYRVARAGEEYLGVCPARYAEAFLREYERGKRGWSGPDVGLSVGVGSGGRVGWGVGMGFPIFGRRVY